MAKLVYWDIINGDDANDGLTIGAPVRTLTRVHAVVADGDRVIVAPGVYPSSVLGGTSSFPITKSIMFTPQKTGVVIFDFEGQLPTGNSGSHIALITSGKTLVFRGIQFRNMGVGKYALAATIASMYVIDCVFYQRDGAAQTGRGVIGTATGTHLDNCTFYNIERVLQTGRLFSNYVVDVTTLGTVSAQDYNAYSGNAEPNGIDTDDANSDPGFVDAAGEDFRLDPTDTVAIAKFRTLGQFGGPIGATGAPGPWWDARFAQSRWLAPDPTPGAGMHGSWVNDPDYVDPGGTGTTGEIVEDVGDFEPIVDLSANPSALSGRLLSPVMDQGEAAAVLNAFTLARFQDGPAGAVIDVDDLLPEELEYRQSASSFGQTDPESTDLAWQTFELSDQLDLSERYQQVAITFQVNHTNSFT